MTPSGPVAVAPAKVAWARPRRRKNERSTVVYAPVEFGGGYFAAAKKRTFAIGRAGKPCRVMWSFNHRGCGIQPPQIAVQGGWNARAAEELEPLREGGKRLIWRNAARANHTINRPHSHCAY